MTKPVTTVAVSKVRAAMFRKEIANAASLAELEAAAKRHSDWLISGDREKLRPLYREKKLDLGGAAE